MSGHRATETQRFSLCLRGSVAEFALDPSIAGRYVFGIFGLSLAVKVGSGHLATCNSGGNYMSSRPNGLMRIFAALLTFVFAALFPLDAPGQTSTATLTGTVRDSSGAVLPGVAITVTSTERNTSYSTISNETGNYVVPALNPGAYSVAAELTGFKKFVQEGIVLQVNQVARIDITLDV